MEIEMSPRVEDEMPQECKDIGFSGAFTRILQLNSTAEEAETFAASLPKFLPGHRDKIMALRMVDGFDEPHVLLVWRDAEAIVAALATKVIPI